MKHGVEPKNGLRKHRLSPRHQCNGLCRSKSAYRPDHVGQPLGYRTPLGQSYDPDIAYSTPTSSGKTSPRSPELAVADGASARALEGMSLERTPVRLQKEPGVVTLT